MDFKLVSDYAPMGDQPEAIGQLVSSIEHGSKHNTLLGVTGSGKTFTVANVIARLNRPTLVLSHNKTLAAQLYGEFRNFFPENAVEYFVSYYDYYQPEAYLPSTDTYIEKDLQINAEIEKMRLGTGRHAAVGPPRRDRRVERLVPLRRGQPGGLPRHGHQHQGGAGRQLQAFPLQAGRGALHPHRTRAGACDVPRQRRHGGHHGGLRRVRQPVLPRDVLRQRGGGHPVDRPRHGTAHRLARQHHALRHERCS